MCYINRHNVFTRSLILIFFALFAMNSFAQYDTVHYIPPFYSRTDNPLDLGRSYLHLSTNVTTPFTVHLMKGDGSEIAEIQISKDQPQKIWLGYQFNCIGIVDSTQLNMVGSEDGIVATADRPFFANIRHKSAQQGLSLTCKGASALGTRFRSGHLYTTQSGQDDVGYKSHMISVMASEDNTTVTFSDIKSGVIFHNTPVTGNTSNDITVTLNKYETYVIATHLDEPMSTGNDTLVNGVLIESTKPIAVNSGSWTGGSDQVNNLAYRDIGVDQIVPVSMIGKEYVISKRYSYLEEECERVIIVADEDNTELFFNGNNNSTVTLQAGEFYIAPAATYQNDIMYVQSTNPVYVYQSTNGSATASYTLGMNFIPPIACSGLNEVTIHEADSFDGAPAAIDIIARVGAVIEVNDTTLTAPAHAIPGNTDWEVYRLYNVQGNVHVQSAENIYVSMFTSTGARGAAGYFSGFSGKDAYPEVTAAYDNNAAEMTEGCVGGRFIVTKPIQYLDQDVTYTLSISGSAQNGIDYTLINNTIQIPAGQLEGVIQIDPLADQETESAEEITLSINSGGCSDPKESAATLIIGADPTLDFNVATITGCAPFEVEFENLSASENGTYVWSFGDGNSEEIDAPVHTFETPGIYHVTLYLIDANGCGDTLSLTKTDIVQVMETPVAGFELSPDGTDICHSGVAVFDESIGGASYYYNFDDANSFSAEANPYHIFQTDGNHHITQVVIGENGCSDTTSRELFIEPFNVFIPNTFTPDGNEFNNIFNAVVDLSVYEWDLSIYNRWGEEVFRTMDQEIGWDGTCADGQMAQDGTYQWVLRLVSCEPQGVAKMMNGHVNLIR